MTVYSLVGEMGLVVCQEASNCLEERSEEEEQHQNLVTLKRVGPTNSMHHLLLCYQTRPRKSPQRGLTIQRSDKFALLSSNC
jgi:hypothetical protein